MLDASHIIVGSSAHNKRIEQLWRDVHRCVLKLFADKFRLEQSGLLDPTNEVDIFCLHVCRIKHCINSFEEAWNNHCVSTEGNATPYQLFVAGLLSVGQIPDVLQYQSQLPRLYPLLVNMFKFHVHVLHHVLHYNSKYIYVLTHYKVWIILKMDCTSLLCLLLGNICHYLVLIVPNISVHYVN